MMDIAYIDSLFKKFYRQDALAVKELGQVSFPKGKKVNKIAMYYSKLSAGGVEKVISLLAPMYLQLGYEVVIIAEHIAPEIDYDFPKGVELFSIPAKQECIKRNEYKIRGEAIQKLIRNQQIDTIVYHEATSYFLLYDVLTYKNEGVNFILVKHEIFSQYMVNGTDYLYMQKNVFPLMDKVLVLGNVEKKFWQYLGIKADYIYNPVKSDIPEKGENGEKNIVWIGRLDYLQKQYTDLVPIMKAVVKEVPDAVLKIYGSEYDKGSINILHEMILSEGLEENIKYCGYVKDNIEDVYSQATVHLVTSAYESFGMTMYESRVSGVPLVLYKMPYLEIVRNMGGYIAVDNDDKEAAAKAIVDILLNKELSKNLSEEALESVVVFNNEELKTRWKEIFDSFSNSHKSDVEKQIVKDGDIETILDMFMYHYHKGVIYSEKQQQERPILTAKRIKNNEMKAKLQIAIQHKRLPVVLYPYGKIGKEIKIVLNQELGVQEAFVVDNHYTEADELVKTLEELGELDCSKYLFLVCSNNLKCYDELRNNLREIVPEDNIIDLYPM